MELKKAPFSKRVTYSSAGLVLFAGGFLSIGAVKFESRIVPKTFVGPVEVGGLSREDAKKKIRLWWETERQTPIKVKLHGVQEPLATLNFTAFGLVVDDVKSVDGLPMTDFWGDMKDRVTGEEFKPRKFELKLGHNASPALANLASLAAKSMPARHPARVYYDGSFKYLPEVSTQTLDIENLGARIEALVGEKATEVEIATKDAPKKVSDEDLHKINEIVSTYTTHFPGYMTNRNTNIRLAASKMNGIVVAPGEKVSFNQVVGRRTLAGGYKVAPVIVNGQHDVGVGGGICQVSSTLYNSALLSGLKVVSRRNHTFPSSYVPIGRDATVAWENPDLVLANDGPIPVAFSSSCTGNTITFRILGKKEAGVSYKIATEGHKSWANGQRIEHDPSLRPGSRHVVDKGGMGHSISTYRIKLVDGKVVSRQRIDTSFYKGGPRIIAVGPTVAKAKIAAALPNATPAVAPLRGARQ